MMRILLVSYYFPPCGGAPVQRWLRFIKELAALGYEICVISPKSGDFPHIDHSLCWEIPSGVKVIRTRSIRLQWFWQQIFGKNASMPYGSLETKPVDGLLKRFLIFLRLNVIIPDIRIFWLPYAFRAVLKELKNRSYNAIITTGPPHSTHLLGLLFRNTTKWIADWRDPWSKIHYLDRSQPLLPARIIHKYLEAMVVSKAHINLIVSNYIASQLPSGMKKVIYNGYSEVDFRDIVYQPTSRFRIKYVGQLTAGQDIIPIIGELVKTLENLAFSSVTINRNSALSPVDAELQSPTNNSYEAKDTGNSQDFLITFIGTTISQDVLYRLKLHNLESYIHLQPFLPHKKAVSEMVQSELLLLIINDYSGSQGMLTTKLFEYLAAKTPILCFGTPSGEAANLINKYKAGLCTDNLADIAPYIWKLFEAWSQNQPLRNSLDTIALSTRKQISELIEVF